MKNKEVGNGRQLSLNSTAAYRVQPSAQDFNGFSNVVNLFSVKPVKSDVNSDASVTSRLMREAGQLDW